MVSLSVYFLTVAVTLAFSTAAAPMPRGQGRHVVRHAYSDVPPAVSAASRTSLANKTQAAAQFAPASDYPAVPPATSTHVPPAAYSDVHSADGTVVHPHRSTPVPSANETLLASGTKYSVPPAASSAVSAAKSILAYWTAHPKYSHPSHVPSPVSPAVPSTSLTGATQTASPLSTYSSSAPSVEPSLTASAVAYTAPASGSILSTGFQSGYANLGVNNALPNLDLGFF